MLRFPARRVLSAIWSLWFVLVVAEPTLVHRCPMHDAVPGVASGATGDAHAGHSTVPAHGASHSEQPERGHECLCLDDSCAAAPFALATTPVAPELVAAVAPVVAPAAGSRIPPARGQHVLPFANGPPHAL